MVYDVQITKREFEQYLQEYPFTFLLGTRIKFEREGGWISFCNRVIDRAKEIFGDVDDIIIAEVVPAIKSRVVLIYGRSRKKPKPIKAVTFYEIENPGYSQLWIMSKKPLNLEQIYLLLRGDDYE